MRVSPNRAATGNVTHGMDVFRRGIMDPVEVYKAHLTWARGAAADYHFSTGYREAAIQAGVDHRQAIRLFGSGLSDADKALVKQLHDQRYAR